MGTGHFFDKYNNNCGFELEFKMEYLGLPNHKEAKAGQNHRNVISYSQPEPD